MNSRPISVVRIVLEAVALLTVGPLFTPTTRGFEPEREFPDSSETIRVFVDQFQGDLSPAQTRFVAKHMCGTQKLLAAQIDGIRKYNPNFLMLHYRLAVRESSPNITHIHNNRWSTDFTEVNKHEDWFLHTFDNPPQRVYQPLGSAKEYIMDLSGRYNGAEFGWKEYFVKTVIEEVKACHADGVFGDSAHTPWIVPAEMWNSQLGKLPCREYVKHMGDFYAYVYKELDKADMYWIPNIGGLCCSWDENECYTRDIHGAMVEGYAHRQSAGDWRLQQGRLLKLLRNGKIYIAQNGAKPEDIEARLWYMANYLLMKHGKSYVNMIPNVQNRICEAHWWPEYDLKIGRAVAPLPKSIEECKNASGVYAREYQKALVLVNPDDAARTVELGRNERYQRVIPWGGGPIDREGKMPEGGLKLEPVEKEVAMLPWSGAILMKAEKQSKDLRQRKKKALRGSAD